MGIGLHVNYSSLLSGLSLNLNFLAKFSKNTQILIFIKIRPMGTELFLKDRRTDMTKLIAKSP